LNKFLIVLIGALVLLVTFSACGGIPFVAQNSATETPTRRAARPTFTPKAKASPTEEIEPTEEPTETEEPQPTDEPTAIPATVKPTKQAAAPKPTKPPAPTEPPKPKFSINITSQFICSQDGINEVVVNVKKGRALVEGVFFAAFDAGGRLLQDGAEKNLITSTYPVSVSTAGNCRLSGSFENPVINNGKLDVADVVRRGTNPIIIRFVKSETDLTPISEDIRIDFGTGGRYWIYTQSN